MGERAAAVTVGLVGAGVMGRGMGANLLAKGFPLVVVAHRRREAVDALVAAGAQEAHGLADLLERCDVVLLCLPDADVAARIVDEIAPVLSPGRLVIDTGTAFPEMARRHEARLSESGIRFAEAPVAGGRQQAEAGTLGAMVGASPEAFAAARPVLAAVSATVEHMGPVGSASVAKLVNNMMVMGLVGLLADAYAIAAEAGIDWQKLYAAMTRGAGDSGVLRRVVPAAVAGDFRAYAFPVAGAVKDLHYFERMMATMGGTPPLAAAVAEAFRREVADGRGDLLLSELFRPEVCRARLKRGRQTPGGG